MIAAVSQPNSRRPHASYHLGTMFMAGEGVPQDFALARRLLEQAANGGYLRATLSLAQLSAEAPGVERDPAKARELALRSPGPGDVESYPWLPRPPRPGGLPGAERGSSALLAENTSALLQLRIREPH